MKNAIKKTLLVIGLAAGVSMPIISAEYADLPAPFDAQQGRTKNAIASVVVGTIGQQLYGNSHVNVNVNVKKYFFSDSKVTGTTTPDSIDTKMDLTFSSNRYTANKNPKSNNFKGKVDKSEIDWKVQQTSQTTYEISRWGPKFDSSLELTIKDGKISGTYIRDGPNIDWDIQGTYDEQGNINVEIDGPLTLGITLEGTINKK